MHSQNNSEKKETKKKSRGRKIITWFLVILVLVVLILFLAIPMYLSSQSGKNLIISRVNPLVDGQIQMAEFSMGWFKGIHLTDFQFADNAGTTQVKVKEISTKPRYGSLLMGNIALGKTMLDTPEIVVSIKESEDDLPRTGASLTSVSEQKYEQEPERKQEQRYEQKDQKPIVLPLAEIDLEVKQGSADIKMETAQQVVRSVQFQDIESRVVLNKIGTESVFDLSLAVTDGAETPAKISANGSVTPAKSKNGWSLKGTNGDFQVVVDNLELETLEPLFSLAGVEFGAKGNLNADIDVRVDNGRVGMLDAKATLADFARAVAGKELVLAEPVELDAKLSSEAEQVVIDKVQVRSSFCTLDCTGGVDSVDYTAEADLKGLQDFAGQFVDFADYSFAGSIVEKGNISFDEKKIAFKGQADIKSFVAGKAEVKTVPTDALISFDMGIDTAQNLMDIGMLKLISEPATIELQADSVPLSTEDGLQFNVKANTTADLNKVQPFAALAVSLPKGLNIAGALDSSITLNSDKTGYHILTDATSVKNLVIAQPDVEPFKQEQINLTADVLCDPAKKTVAINTLNLESKQDGSLIKVTKGAFSQSSEKDQTHLEGQLQADYDLQTVSSMASAFVPQGLTMQGKRTASLEFKSQYPTNEPEKLKQNLSGKASFGFDRAEYMGLEFGQVDTNLKVMNGKLTVEPFSTVLNQGKINFAAEADFNEQPSLLRTTESMLVLDKVRITEGMTKSLLFYLNPFFAEQAGASGIANFQCDKLAIPIGGGSKKDIEIAGAIWLDDLQLKPMGLPSHIFSNQGEFAVEKTHFTLQEGLLAYDDLQLNVGDNPLNFAGAIDIEKETYDLIVKLPYTSDGQTIRIGQDSADRLAPRIVGNLEDGIDWGKLFEGLIESMIKSEGKKLLEKEAEKLLGEEAKKLLDGILK
jgi:hypothetical protein